MNKIAVLILAGTKPGTPNRALWPLHGKPMLDYVLAAVQTALPTTPLFIAGDVPTPSCESSTSITVVPSGKTRLETLLNGVDALHQQDIQARLLVVTADIPFITPEAILDFVQNAPEGDFVYAIVPLNACKKRFPMLKRTSLRIAEGTYTGGNLLLIEPHFLRESAEAILQAEKRRKSVIGLAQMLGGETFMRFLASFIAPGSLTISYLENKVSQAIGGAKVRVYASPYAEVGTDIDSDAERLLAESLLAPLN